MNPQTGESNATHRHSLEINGAISSTSKSDIDDGYGKISRSKAPNLEETVQCAFCETRVSIYATIRVRPLKNPQQVELICFVCVEKTRLSPKDFLARMNSLNWKNSPCGTIPLRCVQTNCEFCDALVLISDAIEVSNPKEFEGKPIFICTLCAEKTKLTDENMTDVLNCHEWTMSEHFRFFMQTMLKINYGIWNATAPQHSDLDGMNPGGVLGFVYKRRKCNICQMHLKMYETMDQHFQTHRSNSENLMLLECSRCCEGIIGRGNELYRHMSTCGLYCADCRKWFPKHSLHYKMNHSEIAADGKCVKQVFICPAPGCFFKCKEDNLLIDHLATSNYFWKLIPRSDHYLNMQELQSLPDSSIMNDL